MALRMRDKEKKGRAEVHFLESENDTVDPFSVPVWENGYPLSGARFFELKPFEQFYHLLSGKGLFSFSLIPLFSS